MAPPPTVYFEQRDQPDGVPPLALTGERTLPDVPEENYWFRRHLVVYEWIAARRRRAARDRHGLRRGLRLGRARAHAPRASSASTPTPRPTSTPACATRAPNLRFERELVENFSEPRRRRRVPADDRAPRATRRRCSTTSARSSGSDGVVFVSTPNVLTLAPEGAERSDNPWHVHEYRCRGVRAALCRAHFAIVEMYGLFHARKLRAHELALRLGWDRVHPRLRLTRPLLRLVHAGDRRRATSRCAPADAAGPATARSTSSRSAGREPRSAAGAARWRSSCTRTCPTSRASGRGRSARSGCGRRSPAVTCRCWSARRRARR